MVWFLSYVLNLGSHGYTARSVHLGRPQMRPEHPNESDYICQDQYEHMNESIVGMNTGLTN